MPNKKLSKSEETYIKKMAKKYDYDYKVAVSKYFEAYKNAEKSSPDNVHALARKIFKGDLKKKNDIEETITTTTAGVGPGGSGEFKHRAWGDAIAKQYKEDEKQRNKVLKYLKRNLN